MDIYTISNIKARGSASVKGWMMRLSTFCFAANGVEFNYYWFYCEFASPPHIVLV